MNEWENSINEWVDEWSALLGLWMRHAQVLGSWEQRKRRFQGKGKIWKEKRPNSFGALAALQEQCRVLRLFLSFILCPKHHGAPLTDINQRFREVTTCPASVLSTSCRGQTWSTSRSPTWHSSPPAAPLPPAHRLAFPGPGGALSGLSITAGHLESDHRSSCILHLRHKCHWRYYSGGLMGYLSTPCFSKQLGGFSAWMKAPETSVLAWRKNQIDGYYARVPHASLCPGASLLESDPSCSKNWTSFSP